MGSRISEGVELCPYLYDPTFVRSTYIQITKVISDLPLLAYKQANLVKSVRRNFVANYPPVMQEHVKYHEILELVRCGRQIQADHLSLKVSLLNATDGLSDKELDETRRAGLAAATGALATLHSTWLQWVARLKVVCIAALRRSQNTVDIKRFHDLLITLTIQQRLTSQTLEQAVRWRSCIDLDDLIEPSLLLRGLNFSNSGLPD